MTYKVEFYKGDQLFHSKEWDLGLETAKQHANTMTTRYEATSSRVLDAKGREVFTYSAPEQT